MFVMKNVHLKFTFRSKRVHQTDLRIRVMHEIVKSIHLVKMYAWERPFQFRVERIRRFDTFCFLINHR